MIYYNFLWWNYDDLVINSEITCKHILRRFNLLSLVRFNALISFCRFPISKKHSVLTELKILIKGQFF